MDEGGLTLQGFTRLLALSLVLGLGTFPMAAEEVTFSHGDWASVLQASVDEQGLVDYQQVAAHRKRLDRYLHDIAETSPRTSSELFPSRAHELAFYLNAYNALVFEGVLELGSEATTVWGKSGSGFAFFVRQKFSLGGERLSLKGLEDDIIRRGFQDPRIHAALNCASLGCPRLPREPFEGPTLDEALDSAMREFVADPRHVRMEGGSIGVSKIFDWFKKDFLAAQEGRGSEDARLIAFINRYRAAEAQLPADAPLTFLPYDKGLNRQQRLQSP